MRSATYRLPRLSTANPCGSATAGGRPIARSNLYSWACAAEHNRLRNAKVRTPDNALIFFILTSITLLYAEIFERVVGGVCLRIRVYGSNAPRTQVVSLLQNIDS